MSTHVSPGDVGYSRPYHQLSERTLERIQRVSSDVDSCTRERSRGRGSAEGAQSPGSRGCGTDRAWEKEVHGQQLTASRRPLREGLKTILAVDQTVAAAWRAWSRWSCHLCLTVDLHHEVWTVRYILVLVHPKAIGIWAGCASQAREECPSPMKPRCFHSTRLPPLAGTAAR